MNIVTLIILWIDSVTGAYMLGKYLAYKHAAKDMEEFRRFSANEWLRASRLPYAPVHSEHPLSEYEQSESKEVE